MTQQSGHDMHDCGTDIPSKLTEVDLEMYIFKTYYSPVNYSYLLEKLCLLDYKS